MFSPSGTLIASAGNDSAAKIWDRHGKFLASCRGHIGPVYRLAWAPDSRMLVTATQDSTIKLWNPKVMIFMTLLRDNDLQNGAMIMDLPGHGGSVFAIDWAPRGSLVACGGADRMLKLFA